MSLGFSGAPWSGCCCFGASAGRSFSLIVGHLRRRFARFKLCAHLLDLRGLLFETRSEGLYFFLLLRHRSSEVLR